ncbi:MAG: hypothetical protein HC910_09145 [Spirulinaceae cyanobacterium SM2_1_0]|nr:hypothetical protein [Spirulinaceae cyanobacterium SM2_1_0]
MTAAPPAQSLNLAIQGIVNPLASQGKIAHVACTAVEHDAGLAIGCALAQLVQHGVNNVIIVGRSEPILSPVSIPQKSQTLTQPARKVGEGFWLPAPDWGAGLGMRAARLGFPAQDWESMTD